MEKTVSKARTTSHSKSSGKTHLLPLVSIYLLFIAVTTSITYNISITVQKDLLEAVNLQLNKESLIDDQINAIHTRHVLVRDILLEEDPFIKDDYIQLHAEYARRVLRARRALEKLPLSPREKKLIDKQWNDSRTGFGIQGRLIEASMDASHDERMNLYGELIAKTQAAFLRRMDELSSYRTELRAISGEILNKAEETQLRNWFLIIIFYLLTLAGGAIAVLWMYMRQREHQETLLWETTHDPLTQLPNRNEFEHKIQEAIDSFDSSQSSTILLHLDIDYFKLINDSCGHTAGDELLKQIAAITENCVRSVDIVARIGGDEFGILLQNCDPTHAHKIADGIRSKVEDYSFTWSGKKFDLGVSIGLVAIDENHDNVTDLLSSADTARYTAKELGRNRVHVFQREDQISSARLKELEQVNHIRKALHENSFVLYGQRITPVNDNLEEHQEVLLRLVGDKGEIILPAEFLPVAEQYNLISSIDLWVLKHTCEHILNSTHLNTCFSINLSGTTLSDQAQLDALISTINNSGVNPELLVFEITETSAISNLTSAVNFMHKVKDIGCRFALDDFGSGLSSFTYLKQMPVDFLKIDGSFIHQLRPNTLDFSFVQSIHSIAKTMGLLTVAEWVEDQTVLDYLAVLGIDYAQGNYVHVPAPLTPSENS